MPIERPTFHESWYRVADLHPRLRSKVQISRQHFRAMPWHVVQDHANNAFFRLAEPAYRFIGLLDGKRTVGEAWKITNEHLGDDAPTQGEVIQLLGQLYTANLLQAEVPADTHTLFARYRKRKQREITSYLMNIMFARIPIFDPDSFLNKWLPLLGWIFSPLGAIVWIILIAAGVYSISEVSNWSEKLFQPTSGLLSPDNLIMLYVSFAVIKACHEMGHAISCKKFGRQSGTGGEVHIIGIMFLVFTPVPYVDASSSWALTNKWHRAIVGAAGMWVELAISAIAAMVWAHSNEGNWVHNFAYNIMFVASFSTIVFNANPLLRYDGYYILSDLLEIPNLAQRSKDYIFYLVKRYVWNVRFARNPANGTSEKFWLFVYAIASFIMRIFVTFSIMFYLTTVLNGVLIILATGMAIAGIVTWVLVPVGKFLHYLFTNPELARVRGRAIFTSAFVVAAIVTAVGFINFPDHARAQGVVQPDDDYMTEVYAHGDGILEAMYMDPARAAPPRVLPVVAHLPVVMPEIVLATDGELVAHWAPTLQSDPLVASLAMPTVEKGEVFFRARNRELEYQITGMEADRDRFEYRLNLALADTDPKNQGMVKAVQSQIDGLNTQIAALKDRLGDLTLQAPMSGVLMAPAMEDKKYGYVKRTDRIGLIADLHHLIVRAAAANELGGPLSDETQAGSEVEIRVLGRPDILLTGKIAARISAGTTELPSQSLGYQVGGSLNTAPDDKQGTKTVENFFELRIDRLKLKEAPADIRAEFENTADVPLLPGQRVVVRFTLQPKPLAVQGWTALLQLFQKKFQF